MRRRMDGGYYNPFHFFNDFFHHIKLIPGTSGTSQGLRGAGPPGPTGPPGTAGPEQGPIGPAGTDRTSGRRDPESGLRRRGCERTDDIAGEAAMPLSVPPTVRTCSYGARAEIPCTDLSHTVRHVVRLDSSRVHGDAFRCPILFIAAGEHRDHGHKRKCREHVEQGSMFPAELREVPFRSASSAFSDEGMQAAFLMREVFPQVIASMR